jgi:hypothetical protein
MAKPRGEATRFAVLAAQHLAHTERREVQAGLGMTSSSSTSARNSWRRRLSDIIAATGLLKPTLALPYSGAQLIRAARATGGRQRAGQVGHQQAAWQACR